MLAEAHISDCNKEILVQITEYDIMKNPSLIMQATNREEIAGKLKIRLDNLDQNIRDIYLILFTHWFKNQVKDGLENHGSAYIDISDIHFGYKGLLAKNRHYSIMQTQYEDYIKSIEVLANTKVKIDITKETNVVYEKVRSLGWKAIEGLLINDIRWVLDKNDKVIGIWYNMGIIGEAYTKYIPNINDRYPKALLNLETFERIMLLLKNIGNYLCFLHYSNKEKKSRSKINLYVLMGESRYEIKAPNIQRYID